MKNRKFIYFSILLFLLQSCSGHNYSSVYVSSETNFNDKNDFVVFVQDSDNSSFYYGFSVGLEIDTSGIKYSNLYRLKQAEVYKFDGISMIKTGMVALTNGESEFVYKTSDKIDFTGGYHGDEQLTTVDFYIDNVQLDLTKSFSLLPCNEFKYIQKSTTHETATQDGGVNMEHPIESIHSKITSFSSGGYKTTNEVQWMKELKIEKLYGSLVCVSRDFGGYGKSKSIETVKFDLAGDYKLESTDRSIHMWNDENQTEVFINSNFSVFNDSAKQFIWDHKVYNKYYRNIGPVNTSINDRWYFSTEVKFSIK